MDSDDVAYRRSVRNMAFVLGAILITIFSALALVPLLNPPPSQFSKSVYTTSPYGFVLRMNLSGTEANANGVVTIGLWMNSTSSQIQNVTARDDWQVNRSLLWGKLCIPSWPIGIGIMKGFYTENNYTHGSLVATNPLAARCLSAGKPEYFLIQPYGSRAIVSLGGQLATWTLQTSLDFGNGSPSKQLSVYTAVGADEWGDIIITHFQSN